MHLLDTVTGRDGDLVIAWCLPLGADVKMTGASPLWTHGYTILLLPWPRSLGANVHSSGNWASFAPYRAATGRVTRVAPRGRPDPVTNSYAGCLPSLNVRSCPHAVIAGGGDLWR